MFTVCYLQCQQSETKLLFDDVAVNKLKYVIGLASKLENAFG